MDVCYDPSYFRDTLHDQIGSEHGPVYVNERVSSLFRCDSCCMTKDDQISSGVSHRPITEGTGESNYVIFYLNFNVNIFEFIHFFIFLIFFNFLISFEFLHFCDVRRKGWNYAHIWEMDVSMALYGNARTPHVFRVTKMS